MPPPASTTISRNLAPKNWQEMSFKWELLPNFLPKSSDKKSEMASHGPWTTFYKDCLVSLVGWIDCACLCSQQMKTSIQSIPPALWKGWVAFLMWGKSGGFDPPFPDNWPQWHVSYMGEPNVNHRMFHYCHMQFTMPNTSTICVKLMGGLLS